MPAVTQAHIDARRRQILEAAYATFAQDGFHRATMHDVAEAAGLSAGALYRYFDGKEDLVRSVAAATRVTEGELIGDPGPDVPAIEALHDAVEALIRALDEPWAAPAIRLSARLHGEALDDPLLLEEVRESNRLLRRRLGKFVRRGQQAGTLSRELEAEEISAVLVSVVRGAGLQKLLDPAVDLEEYAEVARAMVRGLLSGGRPGTLQLVE